MAEHQDNIAIQNIIFDFGGVILNISHNKVESAFKALGVENFETLFNKAAQSDLFQKFEMGRITSGEFRTDLKALAGINISDDSLDEAWNQIIGDYPPNRIELLHAIKKNYRLYLLSNTNIIHYEFYIEKFKNEFGFEFQSLFNDTFWSFMRGLRKPDISAFSDVIDTHRLVPEATLFIDDSNQNILAAKKTGLRAFHLHGDLEITDLFNDSIIDNSFDF
jgi:putative hydrolase of the HAD superfamily